MHEFITVLLAWTQKHDSDRSNKDECLVKKRLGQNREISPRSKQVQKGAGQRIRGQGRESEVRAGRQGQNRQVRNIL